MNIFNKLSIAKSNDVSKKNYIFINYRRSDTPGYAQLIYDHLCNKYTPEQVFIDVDQDPGSNYKKKITEALSICNVMLVLIGSKWLADKMKIKKKNDYVHFEILEAFNRKIYIIPILFDNAKIPEPKDLPEDIRELAHTVVYHINSTQSKKQINDLINLINKITTNRMSDFKKRDKKNKKKINNNYNHRLNLKFMAIDIGTENIRMLLENSGYTIKEKNIVALNKDNKIIAFGINSYNFLFSGIYTVFPVNNGRIEDHALVTMIIRYYTSLYYKLKKFKKIIPIIALKFNISYSEKIIINKIFEDLGCKNVIRIPSIIASAVGSDLPIMEPAANMIMDIGAGKTEIAIVALDVIIISRVIEFGSNEFDNAIKKYFRNYHNFIIDFKTAQIVKHKIELSSSKESESIIIKGNDAIYGLPQKITVKSEMITSALEQPLTQIIDEIKIVLNQTPPELITDIVERGLLLTGGGSLLKNIKRYITQKVGIPVYSIDNPEETTINGLIKLMANKTISDYLF